MVTNINKSTLLNKQTNVEITSLLFMMNSNNMFLNLIFMAVFYNSANSSGNPKKLVQKPSSVRTLMDQVVKKTKQKPDNKQLKRVVKEKKQHAGFKREKKINESTDQVWVKNLDAESNQFKIVDAREGEGRSNLVAFQENGVFTRLGRTERWENLKEDNLNSTRYLKEFYSEFKELCSMDIDHMTPRSISSLISQNRNEGWAINSTSTLNKSREYAKQGQNIYD